MSGRLSLLILAIISCGGLLAPGARKAGADQPPLDSREHLEEILERPLYQRWRLRQERAERDNFKIDEKYLNKFWEFLQECLEKLFDWLSRRSPRSGLAGGLGSIAGSLKAAGWLALALLAAYLAYLVYKTLRSDQLHRARAKILSREQIRKALETGEALALAGSGWLQEAERLVAEGNFRAVYRALYLALLSGLHTAGKIDFRRNRTNWMYVFFFRGPEGEKESFSRLTALFDEIWYGEKPAPGYSLSQLKDQVARLTRKEIQHA
ncbi:MAG: DUF4129 domain-containing protein [Planctomycetes bacterium]|nr:DUF4129 domain-containing protein [Planctomycetota bacterium]